MRTLTVTLVLLLSAGCAHYGALEGDFGKSYGMAKQSQILNPGASKNTAPVTGLPGKAADGAVKKYTESFNPSDHAPQQPQQSVNIQLPTGMGQDAYGKK